MRTIRRNPIACIILAFIVIGLLALAACTDRDDAKDWGAQCVRNGDTVDSCYIACSATWASKTGAYVRSCAAGVQSAR